MNVVEPSPLIPFVQLWHSEVHDIKFPLVIIPHEAMSKKKVTHLQEPPTKCQKVIFGTGLLRSNVKCTGLLQSSWHGRWSGLAKGSFLWLDFMMKNSPKIVFDSLRGVKA